MKKIITYTVCLFFAITVQAQERQKQEQPATQFPSAGSFANSTFTYKVIDAPEKTFGYDIYADNRLMIHQSSIPGMPGNKGFNKKADAEKVAQLVISKIKKGEMPPTVTKEDMQQLKVIK